jgi:hypothetical protein
MKTRSLMNLARLEAFSEGRQQGAHPLWRKSHSHTGQPMHTQETMFVPITSLDPRTALVVIDLQKGVVQNAVRLVDAFRAKRLPVVLVHVGWAADFGDALQTRNQTPALEIIFPRLGEIGTTEQILAQLGTI